MKTTLLFLLFFSTLCPAKVERALFGKTQEGKRIESFTCSNNKGLKLKLISLGARVVSLETPDRNGKRENITLGFSDVLAYEKHTAHFGGIVGRYANRIALGKFPLEGKTYTLATNNSPNHLHGGIRGFDNVVWKAENLSRSSLCGMDFQYASKDGEEGYPGNVLVRVSYLLTDENELKITYRATTDHVTIINLTNHIYWNLGGPENKNILEETLVLEADQYLPIDKTSIPLGTLKDVKGTPMDFTTPHTLGERMAELKKDPEGTRGYDHCYALRNQTGKLALAAKLSDPKSGRSMELSTTEPGLQLYTSNFLDGSAGNGGFSQHQAVCLEAQHFPDSPNHSNFPSTILRPGETYRQETVHRFFVTP